MLKKRDVCEDECGHILQFEKFRTLPRRICELDDCMDGKGTLYKLGEHTTCTTWLNQPENSCGLAKHDLMHTILNSPKCQPTTLSPIFWPTTVEIVNDICATLQQMTAGLHMDEIKLHIESLININRQETITMLSTQVVIDSVHRIALHKYNKDLYGSQNIIDLPSSSRDIIFFY